jgi:outer membrane lipopolysaccharide assembly protein LptE/RlpB
MCLCLPCFESLGMVFAVACGWHLQKYFDLPFASVEYSN